MPKFSVQITETLQKIVTVEAENEDEALQEVREGWEDGTYILDADNFMEVDFDLWDDETGDIKRA